MIAPDLFAEATARTTPMMAQYLAAKAQHPDSLLFYRMGDFYELFFEDAQKASRALDIALTKRGQHNGAEVPMCGVPVHSHTGYVARLIKAGFRVAICEQTETPEEAKKRGGKALVTREVVRVITPGTLTEEQLLEARANNHLLCLVAAERESFGAAWCDLSTGAFGVASVGADELPSLLARLEPQELLLPEGLEVGECEAPRTLRPRSLFHPDNCKQHLLDFYKVAALDMFGDFNEGETTAAGALLDYVLLTQVGACPVLSPPQKQLSSASLEIDAATRRNLELTRTTSGEKAGSLLAVLDDTVTAAGARLLAARLAMPLCDVSIIKARLEAATWAKDAEVTEKILPLLRQCPDLERALSRLALGRGGPRDLAAVRDALVLSGDILLLLRGEKVGGELAQVVADLAGPEALSLRLSKALAAELPMLAREGGFIRAGYDLALDEQRSLRDESRRLIAALQARYVSETGYNTLKIKHNNIIGYHVELSPPQADKLLQSEFATTFIHRQTMAGAVRFTTTELVNLERDISQAAERALALELKLFEDLVDEVKAAAGPLALLAHALALFDHTLALARLAANLHWVCPVVDDSLAFAVVGGRHPVVEAALKAAAKPRFVANDCKLEAAQRLWLMTGPNMAGKSTFLRQNALLVVLAQMGSYVPAKAMHLGVVDRLFSRVGAADDLARGRSTFMVEMVETANILHRATSKSLVILDEIGRGTATYDGLAIAQAVVEHLHHTSQCRALFATHYHELTALEAALPHLACFTLAVQDWQGEVIFRHEVVAGKADRSYGLHVAALAGLPKEVLTRANHLLESFERGEKPKVDYAPRSRPISPLEAAVTGLDVDAISPREALDVLYRLKKL